MNTARTAIALASALLCGSLLCGTLLCGSLHAQGTTWIVDPTGAPGSNFTTVVDAVDAANPLDTIVVRGGTYTSGFNTDKPLTILGVPGFTISGPDERVIIRGIPAGLVFTMVNATAIDIELNNCLGRVHLQGCATAGATASSPVDGVIVGACNQVTLTGCSFAGTPAVFANRSDVTLSGCVLSGSDSTVSAPSVVTTSGYGLRARRSTVALSDTTVTGGAGATSGPASQPGRQGIFAQNSTLTVTGFSSPTIAAGTDPVLTPVEAILGDAASSLDIDPDVGLQSAHGAPTTAGFGVTSPREIVAVTTTGGALGGAGAASAASPPGDVVAILFGVPVAVTATPFGSVYLDLGTALAFGAVQPATGVTSLPFQVPNLPTLQGAILSVQAANYYQSSGQIELSNVSDVILH